MKQSQMVRPMNLTDTFGDQPNFFGNSITPKNNESQEIKFGANYFAQEESANEFGTAHMPEHEEAKESGETE